MGALIPNEIGVHREWFDIKPRNVLHAFLEPDRGLTCRRQQQKSERFSERERPVVSQCLRPKQYQECEYAVGRTDAVAHAARRGVIHL